MVRENARLRARVRDLETALGLNNPTLHNTFHLAPQRANLLGLLMALPNVTAHTVKQQLEIGSDPKQILCLLRKDLKAFSDKCGCEPFLIHHRRGFGTWMDEATKVRIRACVAATPALPAMAADVDESLLDSVMRDATTSTL